jgi:exopolyphosphatase / guanosine-5'-triphosphate,3'-diphosphate pyrophosphatase
MRVAVIDVGSNTVRLLVAAAADGGIEPLHEEREHLLLGEEVERSGRLSVEKVAEAVACARGYARVARDAGAARLEVVVTAPGRQSRNADDLLRRLAGATGAGVRLLTPEEEGRLAFAGAVAGAVNPPDSVAVCDVGGGSTEVVVGTPADGPVWIRGLDIGCVRLTERLLGKDPPGKKAFAAASDEVERHLEGFVSPLPRGAYATGGTARAVRKLVGNTLGPGELETALGIVAKRPSQRTAKAFNIHPRRARTLVAGVLLLAAIQRRLAVPLEVSRAGLREGVALDLLAEAAAA